MNSIIELSFLQMGAAYIFVIILLFILRARGIKREKELLMASIRMTIQLSLVGYILAYIFEENHLLLVILAILIMQVFAINNVYKRIHYPLNKKIKKLIAIAMLIGTLSSIIYFIVVVIQVSPWYEARYFIPISGMMIGNAMTGVALGTQRLIEGMQDNRDKIETALMLGAHPRLAAKKVVNQAFDAAILPTINSMVGMGIVLLPGMMTGQILAGLSPLIAIRYQIAIMLGITGSVSLSVILFVQFGYKAFFNEKYQFTGKLRESD